MFTLNASIFDFDSVCLCIDLLSSRASGICVSSLTLFILYAAGPVTILNWSFTRKDVSRSVQANQLALALREEMVDLEAAGCKVIQVCHPYCLLCPSTFCPAVVLILVLFTYTILCCAPLPFILFLE